MRRELRNAQAAVDRAASAAGAQEARFKTEQDVLRTRLEQSTARLQGYEREKRLELARGAGDAAALQTELQRALAVIATLRRDLAAAVATAEQHEDAARRELSALRARLAALERGELPPAA